MAVELAAAYLSIVPSFKGVKQNIEREFGGAEREAEGAGRQSGGRFSEGMKGAMTGMLAGAAGLMGVDLLMTSLMGEIDKAQMPAQLGAQFGLAAPEAAEAARIAGEVYAKGWGESIGAVGASVATLGRTLKNLGTNEDVSRLTTQAEALASTFGQDVNAVITAAEQMVRTGLAPTMEAAFDAITKGFQGGADSGQDLLDTINEYSGQFQKLGITGPAAMGLLNQGLLAGARNSDLVADAFKEFSIRAVDGSKTSAEGFAALGLSAQEMTATFAAGGPGAASALDMVLGRLRDMKDPAAQSQAAVALFGTQAEDLGSALYALDPAAAASSDAMSNVEGSAQDLADTVGSGPKSGLEEFTRLIKSELGKALEDVVPLLTKVFDVLTPLAPILTPLALGIGALVIVQWAWNAALAASPVTWIIIGIVALIAAVVWLWNNVEGFKNFFVGAWDAILGGIQFLWNWVKDNWPYLLIFLTGPFALIIGAVVLFWDEISGFFSAGWRWIQEIFRSGVERALEFFSWFGELPDKLGGWIGDAVRGGIKKLGEFITWVKGIPDRVVDALSGLASAVGEVFRGVFNGLADVWNSTIGSWEIGVPSWVPVIGGQTWSVPDIPHLARGGIIPQTPGGRLAVIGEGREDEAVLPLSRLRSLLDVHATEAQPAAAGAGGGNTYIVNEARTPASSIAAELDWLRRRRP